MTMTTMQLIRSDANFDLFWSKVTRIATDCQVEDLVLTQQRKRPTRYKDGSGEGHFPTDVKSFYKSIYFEAMNSITSAIKARFDLPGYKVYLVQTWGSSCKRCQQRRVRWRIDLHHEVLQGRLWLCSTGMQLTVMSCNLSQVPPKLS